VKEVGDVIVWLYAFKMGECGSRNSTILNANTNVMTFPTCITMHRIKELREYIINWTKLFMWSINRGGKRLG